MELLQSVKQQLLLLYYGQIQSKEKLAFIVSSFTVLVLALTAAIISLNSPDPFTTFTDAKTTLSKDALLTRSNTQFTQSETAKQVPTSTPTPTISKTDEEFRAVLSNALEAVWLKINQLPENQSKTTLNSQAAEARKLLDENNIAEAQIKIAALILAADATEYAYHLSLTPSPTPTLSPTPTVIPTPTPAPLTGQPAPGYSNTTIITEKGRFAIKVIAVDLNNTRMIVDTGNDNNCSNDCQTKSLASYVSANGGFAGVNGTYFCPPDYSECANKKNSFDFPIYNTKFKKWINGNNLFWNDRAILYKNTEALRFNGKASAAWRLLYPTQYPDYELEGAIVSAPGLLEKDEIITNNYPLTEKQKSKGLKAGIGFNGSMVYVVVAQSASMSDLAYIFKTLGATDALNLDAGGSTALWYNGYKAGPGRSLPNAIIFVKK